MAAAAPVRQHPNVRRVAHAGLLAAGFVVSAVAAYFLSRKLGLLDTVPADHA